MGEKELCGSVLHFCPLVAGCSRSYATFHVRRWNSHLQGLIRISPTSLVFGSHWTLAKDQDKQAAERPGSSSTPSFLEGCQLVHLLKNWMCCRTRENSVCREKHGSGSFIDVAGFNQTPPWWQRLVLPVCCFGFSFLNGDIYSVFAWSWGWFCFLSIKLHRKKNSNFG